MSEEANQEDLSVEDILSSIKNILVDEEGAPIEAATEVEKEEDNHPLKMPIEEEQTAEADVFNLDDSMIVPEAKSEESTSDINALLDTPAEKTEPSENLDASITNEDIQKTINISEEINIDNILKDVVPEAETPAVLENNINEEPAADEVKEETIDASASIINNFAKVFAEKQQEHAQPKEEPKQEETPIAQTIQSSVEQTGITDMVKQAIVEQIKESINTHFEQIAANIIAEQTKQWLDANLAAIVEKTVAKEIERVIAKVGS